MAITSLDRLLGKQGEHCHHCYRCLRNLYYADRLEKHMLKCYNSVGQKKTMPKEDDKFKKFDDWNKLLSPPFVLYADIESLLIPPPPLPADDVQKITVLQTHSPIAVGSYLIPHKQLTSYPQRREVIFQTGIGCVQEFCEYLDKLVNDLYRHCKKQCKKPQNRTAEEEKNLMLPLTVNTVKYNLLRKLFKYFIIVTLA